MPDRKSYINALVGTPWERRGLHCWRVVAQIQRDLFGREIPFSDLDMLPRAKVRELMGLPADAYGWREIDAPVDGAVVRMYRIGGNPADLEHAGVYFADGPGYVIHSDDPHGVVPDTLLDIQARGWVPRWFVPKGEDPCSQDSI